MPTNDDVKLPPGRELDRIVSLQEATKISSLSADTLKRHHRKKVIELSPRRLGMRLRDALMLGKRPTRTALNENPRAAGHRRGFCLFGLINTNAPCEGQKGLVRCVLFQACQRPRALSRRAKSQTKSSACRPSWQRSYCANGHWA